MSMQALKTTSALAADIAANDNRRAEIIDFLTSRSPASTSKLNVLTEQQLEVVNWVATGTDNAVVKARAGTGKTFLLLNCLPFMSGNVAIAAYNTKIAKEIAEKVRALGFTRVKVGTFHSFGFNAWRFANPGVKISGTNTGNGEYGRHKFDIIADAIDLPKHMSGFVKSILSLTKQRGMGVLMDMKDLANWMQIVEHFDLDMELVEDILNHYPTREEAIIAGIRFSYAALRHSIKIAHEIVDYDDMLYMPLVGNLRMFQNDWVLVDEAQDSNPVRRALARKMLRAKGRALFVGDNFQAIYGFTGADNDAMDQIVENYDARVFPLTVTHRCARQVVEQAKLLVADYEAAEGNPEGVYRKIDVAEFAKEALVPGQDAILCRNTKPLVELAYSLIKRGIPCHVEGKAIGEAILNLIARWKRIATIPALVDKLEDYRDRETAKLVTKGKDAQAEAVNDRVETVLAIIAGLPVGATLADLRAKVDSMFADTEDGQKRPTVTLMTAHRSKGLEYRRVYVWGRDRYMPSPYARQSWALAQERNLEYVSLTRAMFELVDVFGV